MRILIPLKRYVDDDSGAVTVDWIVLTAMVIALAIGVISVIGPGIQSTASKINNVLTSQLTNY